MTIRHVAGRAANIKGQSNSQPALPTKEVCNCISCGKIYFTASDTADNVTFVGETHTSKPMKATRPYRNLAKFRQEEYAQSYQHALLQGSKQTKSS